MNQLQLNSLLFLDLEINPINQQIFKIGALRVNNFSDNELCTVEKFEQDTQSKDALLSALDAISSMAKGADYLVGHNIIEHDLPILKRVNTNLEFLKLPIIDTLQLSPLAFPKNPYHRLLKDYKLIRSELNSPLHDCEATHSLLIEQLEAFHTFSTENLNELRCYQTILDKVNPAYSHILSNITGLPSLSTEEFEHILPDIVKNHDVNINITHKVCITELNKLIDHEVLFEPDIAFPFLYTLSWLRVSGENSVLAPWVRHQFPETANLITILREKSCQQDHCSYCSTIHNSQKELQRYFGFHDFRYEDFDNQESIQRDIVKLGMRDENIFAILPTGGGKSLCYQLPALNRFFKNGSLTIIISPLQALMKDQVDTLISKQIYSAATLNRLISMPERANVLEKLQMGDIGLLFVSPEQFRSTRFKKAIEQRQIGAWIYDEAHCLSKWGNDFRPDYLYVAKCIKDFAKNQPLPPVACFTATAKQEVIADIKQHFKESLDIEFIDKISLKERENLSFDVIDCPKDEKVTTILQLLTTHIKTEGGAIVFVSRRKNAELIAKQLQAHHWNCEYFHAGLQSNAKNDIQNAFIAGDIQVIVSTNAFGMGVDKQNVRLVIHADIPSSLENYLQEAGRAGRDQDSAHCILLYDKTDTEAQFRMTEFSKLLWQDISAIYKKLHLEQNKRKNTDLIISYQEILKDALVESIDSDDDNADTKVITAIAWLERAGYLERKDNVVRIFPAHIKVSLDQALTHIQSQNLGVRRTQEFSSIVEHIAKHPPNTIISTDDLAELIAGDLEDVSCILTELQKLDILTNNTLLTAYLRHGIVDTSLRRLKFNLWCENRLLELLSEFSPDIEHGEWQSLTLSLLCNHLTKDFDGHELQAPLKSYLSNGKILANEVSKIFKVLSEDKIQNSENSKHNASDHNKIFDIKKNQNPDSLSIKVNGHLSWSDIKLNGEHRRIIAQKILHNLIALAKSTGKDVLVETTFEILQNDIFSDALLSQLYDTTEQQRSMIERCLLYLHNLKILTLNNGMTVMSNALTIKVDLNRRNQYLKSDYALLETHYKEKRLHIHVMNEYAVLALTKLKEALQFVLDYFVMNESMFIKRYFKGRENILALATSEESYHHIMDHLNDVQREIVKSEDDNRLILAGPGSGKTRVIVHRIAYLLRVQRVHSRSIIALAYNRAAANEIRQRLYDLVGNESYGVTVMTYHGIAMKMTGTVYQPSQLNSEQHEVQHQFKKMLRDAIEMLRAEQIDDNSYDSQYDEGELDARSKLLQGYRYILVDEYQDIDEDQYELISALAGRKSLDDDGKLTILAVGDDDQNIYTFRGSSNQYIDRFKEDYHAKIDYLVENYRSTQAIIQAANDVIEHNPNRLKLSHPITIDRMRASQPFYGRWESLDANGRGGQIVVRILKHQDYCAQTFIVLNELKRLVNLDPSVIHSCAIIAKSNEALNSFAGGLMHLGYPYYYQNDQSSHFSTPTHRYFQHLIAQIDSLKQCATLQELLESIHLEDYPLRWQEYFDEAFSQLLLSSLNHSALDCHSIVQWLYDYAYEVPITIKHGVFLGTIHSAKGLEFDHVFILDHLNHYDRDTEEEEERRLFYVGMTRAKETLMLCSFGEKHSIIQSIRNTLDSTVAHKGDHPNLQQDYLLLSPKDIYIDYLGTQINEALQTSSKTLTEGSPLLVEKAHDNTLLFKHPETHAIVAKSSKNFKHNGLDLNKILTCYVHSISQRSITMVNNERVKQSCQCDAWEAIQPMIVYQR